MVVREQVTGNVLNSLLIGSSFYWVPRLSHNCSYNNEFRYTYNFYPRLLSPMVFQSCFINI